MRMEIVVYCQCRRARPLAVGWLHSRRVPFPDWAGKIGPFLPGCH